ncbi:MAG: UDP-N-acetylmuramate--L-alanine ligase [Chloroflexi bacterium]|nr:UDP-N-acetylmuramate--L-alanine ligase [Chloroflexota bacterium]
MSANGTGKRVHFVGIGGIGMSAIARVMMADGWTVSGSDLRPSLLTAELGSQGARIFAGHAAGNVGDVDLVVITAAVKPDNPELVEARRRGLPVIKRAAMLGRLMADRIGIAVAGTHGKTTTSSLIAMVLESDGLDPTILVGGEIVDLGTNAKRGSGPYMVAEADEYDSSFLELTPHIAVVTNIEAEHLDYYGSLNGVVEAFRRFLARVPDDGLIIGCGDDPRVRALAADKDGNDIQAEHFITYGLGDDCLWQATDIRSNSLGGSNFVAVHGGRRAAEFSLAIPGTHNVLNALAAAAVASALGVDPDVTKQTLATFRGARRRFEIKGEAAGVTVVDDYAHHPTEIRATLAAARGRFGERRLVCVFQPHTFSRTKLLLADFATCFQQADDVIIVDIYAAREINEWGISSADLASAIEKPHARYIGELEEAARVLQRELRAGDVLLTLGAGDIDSVATKVLEGLTRR